MLEEPHKDSLSDPSCPEPGGLAWLGSEALPTFLEKQQGRLAQQLGMLSPCTSVLQPHFRKPAEYNEGTGQAAAMEKTALARHSSLG